MLAKGLSDSSSINWWRAIAVGFMANSGSGGKSRIGEALRELTSLKSKRDLELPSIVALLFFHKAAEHVDYQEVDALSSQETRESERASELGLLLAAQFHWYSGIHAESEEHACELLQLSRSLINKVCVRVGRTLMPRLDYRRILLGGCCRPGRANRNAKTGTGTLGMD